MNIDSKRNQELLNVFIFDSNRIFNKDQRFEILLSTRTTTESFDWLLSLSNICWITRNTFFIEIVKWFWFVSIIVIDQFLMISIRVDRLSIWIDDQRNNWNSVTNRFYLIIDTCQKNHETRKESVSVFFSARIENKFTCLFLVEAEPKHSLSIDFPLVLVNARFSRFLVKQFYRTSENLSAES